MEGAKEKQPPKVMILVPGLKKGGPVLGAVALAKHLDKTRCDIRIGCLGRRIPAYDPVIDELESTHISIKFFDIPGWTGLLKWRRVRDYIDMEQIDILNSYGIRPDIVNALADSRCISVSSVRGMIRKEYRLKFGRLIALIFAWLHIRVLRKLDHVIAISHAMKDNLVSEGIPQGQIAYIPNFVDLERLDNPGPADCSSAGIDKTHVNIAYIGNLNAIKRVDWIIRAFSDIIQAGEAADGCRLHIIGDGPLRSKLEALVSDLHIDPYVRFHGYITHVTEVMRALDLIVLASKSEGIPRVLMEAMALGKTCLGPSIDGVKELITHNVNGYLFDPNDYKDLYDQFKHVVAKQAFLDAGVIRRHIETHFNALTGAEKTRQLYQKLLSQ